MGIPGQANHKQKKEKPKTKKEIENEKKRSKIQKQIDESEEEKVNQPIRFNQIRTDPSPTNIWSYSTEKNRSGSLSRKRTKTNPFGPIRI